jgi:S-adenosylmethionine hydrolase
MPLKPNGNIRIITDYGVSDSFNAILVEVISRINPLADVKVVIPDLKSFSIYSASYNLWSLYRYSKKGTIWVVIVDPGVGTSRKAILIQTKNYFFIAPNNGSLTMAIDEDKIEEVIELNNPIFHLRPVSSTFHGRDIFAPVAAYKSLGVDNKVLGDKMDFNEIERIDLSSNDNCYRVINIDKFGNVTLYPKFDLEEGKEIYFSLKKRIKAKVVKTFAEIEDGFGVYYNSIGLPEIGKYKGNASEELEVKEGELVCME